MKAFQNNTLLLCSTTHLCQNLLKPLPVVLLTSFALHPPTRFLLSNLDELESSCLLSLMIARSPLQPTSSMMMVALSRARGESKPLQSLQTGHVDLDLFSWRLFSGKTGGLQANYMAEIFRQGSLTTPTE